MLFLSYWLIFPQNDVYGCGNVINIEFSISIELKVMKKADKIISTLSFVLERKKGGKAKNMLFLPDF